ncbi:penicillin-binding protein activator LpoB [Opitutales bacterium CLA-KB-P66]|uniref:Penicillin-binding protein activator LpoB n=2 Tax=Intestinicryptomonas porci TaxID=2926320 RepID=A0ABU4WHD2_9BACT|nr:penicillin-binding protein activator LpoB [Opitutales bacterium CLA-KB-P66]
MLASGVLDNLNLKQPIKMMVSNVKNKTSEVIDTTMLTNKIIMDLTNSGKVLVIKDDKATQELLEYESERTGKKIGMAKITLTGSISEDREVNSSAREVTYTFIMELNMNGTSRWIGQEQISKQSSRSTFGF